MSETFGESENRSVAESACMRARFGLTCTGRAWCAGKRYGSYNIIAVDISVVVYVIVIVFF